MIRALDILHEAGVTAAAEPQEPSNGWRWLSIDVPWDAATQKLMQSIRLTAARKRIAPVYRSIMNSGRGPSRPSYTILFRDNTEFRRYAIGFYALAKKLGATPEMLEAMNPQLLVRRYVSTVRVQPGSDVWKFLVKYGFQTEPVQAATEPKVTQDLSRAFSVLLAKFKTPRTTTVQGHVVKIARGDDELDDMLFLQTTRADGEEHEVWACDVEINGKIAIEVAVPNRERSGPGPGGAHLQYIHHATGPEDLLQQLVRYLVHSYKAVHASAEPPRKNHGVADALHALLTAFRSAKHLPPIKGHTIEVQTQDGDLLVLSALSQDQRTLYSMQAYEIQDVPEPGVEVEVYHDNGRRIQHRMSDNMTKEQLLRKLLQLLADRIPTQAQAAAEPNRLNVEALEHVFKQMRGTPYAKCASASTRGRNYVAATDYVLADDRKPIWTRPTLILVTQILVRDAGTEVSMRVGQQPNHAYFDAETNELVVLGRVVDVRPKEIGRTHVTDARAAVKYILHCIIKHDDPLRSWR